MVCGWGSDCSKGRKVNAYTDEKYFCMNCSVSIFIVNFNTCALLKRCLESILKHRGHLSIELFVADNGSTDGSPEMVGSSFPQVSLTRYAQNIGYTKALNPLLQFASGNYFLFLHPDIEILGNTLSELVSFLESHSEAGIVGANLYYPDGSPNSCEIMFPGLRNDLLCFAVRFFDKLSVSKLAGERKPMEWSHKSTSKVDSVWNACMMVRKEVFDTVGYFDEQFFYGSVDWDFCKRAGAFGWSVYYLHSAVAIHYERQSFTEEDMIRNDVRYKVDGWPTAACRYLDRHRFLRKHYGPLSVCGVKIVYIVENALRLWLILGSFFFRRVGYRSASFQLKACLQSIQTIMKA